MVTKKISSYLVALLISTAVYGGDIDGSAVLGSALGAAAGTAIGSSAGGKEGAVIGGGVGGALGAAIGSNQGSPKVTSRDTAYQRDGTRRQYDNHPRRHDKGKHKGERKRD